MAPAAGVLESVLRTLLDEERELAALIVLAVQEQEALVASDYEAITRLSDAMLVSAAGLDALEQQRGDLLESICDRDTPLDQLIDLADANGVGGFAPARLRLIARAAELREAQERNAMLLISAMKLHERWINMFSSLATATVTYGADGQQQHRGRQFVSRSA